MQEQYQEQYPYYPYGQQQPNPGDLSLVEQTNPKEVLKEIEQTLKGAVFDSTKQEWIISKFSTPIVNDLGINSLMADARGVINQNTILSNLTTEEISLIIVRLGKSIKNKIKMNWKEFGIDKSNLDTAVFAVTDPAFTALKRAMGEGEKRFLKTSVRAVESWTQNSSAPATASPTAEKLKFWR